MAVIQGDATKATWTSASSEYSATYTSDKGFDGTLSSSLSDRWITNRSEVNTSTYETTAWYQWDWQGDSKKITKIRIGKFGYYGNNFFFPEDCTIYVSDTGSFSGEETSCGQITFTNPSPGAWSDWEDIPTPTSGKYIRLRINTGYPNSYTNGWIGFGEAELEEKDFPDNAYHEHYSDKIELQDSPSIAASEAYHLLTSDNVSLFLIPNESYHSLHSDNVSTYTLLVSNDSYIELFSDKAILLGPVLSPQDTVHLHDSNVYGFLHEIVVYLLSSSDSHIRHYSDYFLRLVSNSVQISADLTIGNINLETSFGMQARLSSPNVSLFANIYQLNKLSGALSAPNIEASGQISHHVELFGNLFVHNISLDGSLKNSSKLSGTVSVPVILLSGNISTNNTLSGEFSVPIANILSQISTDDAPAVTLKHSRW